VLRRLGHVSGGIVDLAVTLRTYGDAIEADFHERYGIEDLDEAMERRGLRWIYVRVKHLPPDSAFIRAIQEGDREEEPESGTLEYTSTGNATQVDTGDEDSVAAFYEQLGVA